MSQISLELNGKPLRCDVPPRTHLADLIRDEAGLTGTHLGCEHGVCGACTVLLDGQPVRSCITFAAACDGARVTTVEGYDDDAVMALLRAAFTRHHALQCGYCTPGMLAAARDIVLRLPEADEARVRAELAGNLCRCTGYMGIVAAVLDVLAQCRTEPHPAVQALRAQHPPLAAAASVAAFAGFAAFEPLEATPPVPAAGSALPAPAPGAARDGAGTRIQGAFTVPQPGEAVWRFMADLAAVAACLPGAELTEHAGERVKGRVAIRFGPMRASFAGAARLERDDATRSAVLKGAGQDSLSQSRATGDVAYRLVELAPDCTRVEVELLYSLQGPLAQFSRSGLVRDFVARMIEEFGRNVAQRMDPAAAAPGAPPLPPAQVNALALAWSVLWQRLRRLLGRRA